MGDKISHSGHEWHESWCGNERNGGLREARMMVQWGSKYGQVNQY